MIPIFINIFALCSGLILIYILWVLPAKTSDRNLYLNILTIAIAIHLMAEQLVLLDVINVRIFSIPSVMSVLVIAPSLYYYARTFYNLPKGNFLLHIIPYQIGLAIIYFLIFSKIYLVPQWFFSLYYASVLLIYLVLTIRLKRNKLKKHQKWMKTIGIGFGILVLLHVIEVVLINVFFDYREQVASINTSIQNSFSCLFFIVVIRQIITNPQPFSSSTLRVPNRHNNPNVSRSELKLILSYIEEKKAYQNPALKSALVSEETGLSVNQISEIVNSVFKKNFNEWVNDFRIKDAKHLLSDTDLSIKEIFYRVGFNSKSAFNTAFKSRIAETPSEFRNKKSI